MFIGLGFVPISIGREELGKAQRKHRPAETGIHAWVRHPRYDGLILVMSGFLPQWPTPAMFPVLVFMDMRPARTEERKALAEFGEPHARCLHEAPGFLPHWAKLFQSGHGAAP